MFFSSSSSRRIFSSFDESSRRFASICCFSFSYFSLRVFTRSSYPFMEFSSAVMFSLHASSPSEASFSCALKSETSFSLSALVLSMFSDRVSTSSRPDRAEDLLTLLALSFSDTSFSFFVSSRILSAFSSFAFTIDSASSERAPSSSLFTAICPSSETIFSSFSLICCTVSARSPSVISISLLIRSIDWQLCSIVFSSTAIFEFIPDNSSSYCDIP